jgi:hypothetical protein
MLTCIFFSLLICFQLIFVPEFLLSGVETIDKDVQVLFCSAARRKRRFRLQILGSQSGL